MQPVGRGQQADKVQLVEVEETRGHRDREPPALARNVRRATPPARRLPEQAQAPPPASAAQHTQPPAPALPERAGTRHSQAKQRVEAGVCDGRMWHESCRQEQPPLPVLSVSFDDANHYISTMEPWLIEEARCAVLKDFEAAYAGQKGCAVTVARLRNEADGWTTAWLTPVAAEADFMHKLRDGNIVVLELMQQQEPPPQMLPPLPPPPPPPRGQALQQAQQQAQQGQHGQEQVPRLSKRARLDDRESSGGSRPSTPPRAPLMLPQAQQPQQQQQQQVMLSAQPSSNDGAGLRMTAVLRVAAGQLGTEIQVEVRPCCSFHQPGAAAAPACVGSAARLAEPGRLWWLTPVGSIMTSVREIETLSKAAAMPLMAPLLRPDRLLTVKLERLEQHKVWPAELTGRGDYVNFLKGRYDKTQLEAIELAATHMAGPDPAFVRLQQQVEQQQQRQQGQQQHDEDGGAAGDDRRDRDYASSSVGDSSAGSSANQAMRLPITLIQGPPGTGKTHTVIGILNTWHLTQYQRCYGSLHAKLRHLTVEDLLQGLAALPGLAPKPRILVCAHSNAAVDELLERLLAEGFCDAAGAMYRPSVVRVGAEEALSEHVKRVWVEHLAQRLLRMGPAEWRAERYTKNGKLGQLRRQVEQLKMALDDDPADSVQLVLNLARAVVDHERAALELARLDAVERLVHNRGGGHGQHRGGSGEREVKDWLELSFVEEAEMVFVTLSSSARRVFERVKRQFEYVLIDEAAQAAEVSGLQPLVYGAIGVVLVGDPQQLPATVFSAAAREAQMERSLFERLQQAGAPVKVLNVQYRMHPHIREFPSRYFYQDRLIDAPSVTHRPQALFYSRNALTPYVVFDVARGVERHFQHSACNDAEADMVVALFWELRTFLQECVDKWMAKQGPQPERVKVGVITPYRSQRTLIRDVLTSKLGPTIAAEVTVETVDSFQGKQMDIIILSLVRARGNAANGAAAGGVGFLADTRRMNVAITRAQQALWIVGNLRTLQGDPTWSALIEDATARGMVLADCVASEFYPEHEYPGEARAAMFGNVRGGGGGGGGYGGGGHGGGNRGGGGGGNRGGGGGGNRGGGGGKRGGGRPDHGGGNAGAARY